MSTLIKIKDVCLYVGMTDNVNDCLAFRNILKDSNVSHRTSIILLPADIEATFNTVSNDLYGPDYMQHTITSFPFVIWTECYDDYERWLEYSGSLAELPNSNLIKYKNLVE
jgi:hypothetical protein